MILVYCVKCGEEIPEDARFCHKCGHLTTKGEEEGATYPRLNRYGWGLFKGYRRYIAEDRKSFSGPVVADRVFFEVENVNGPVRVSTWDKSEYSVELMIEAGGYTMEEAEEILDALKIDLKEEVVQGQQRLSLKLDRPRDGWRWLSIEIDVILPIDVEIDLDVGSSNGGISLSHLRGGALKLGTKNGRIALDDVSAKKITCRTSNGHMILDNVSAETIRGETSNGQIEGVVESKDASLSTSNGKIDLTLPCTISGDYDLHTSNGRIDLNVSGSGEVGYSLDLHTSMSKIYVDLPDLEYRKHRRTQIIARTVGLESKNVQITIEADTSLGKIKINS